MKKWILFFLIPLLPLVRADQEVLERDQAVFKVHNQIYFFSELSTLVKQVEMMRCSFPESYLLKASDLDVVALPELPNMTLDSLPDHYSFVENLIKLVKILLSIKGQDIILPRAKWPNFEQMAREKHCPLWTEFFEDPTLLSKAEAFFKGRFQDSHQNSQKNNNIGEAIELFVNSLFRQTHHEYYIEWKK